MLAVVEQQRTKVEYETFCESTYVPIFSQPWWMDAVCGEANWDVWLYQSGGETYAALPYFIKTDGALKVITKAILTQNNGLIIKYPIGQKQCGRLAFEEKIMNAAMDFIESLEIDRYEQQFHYSVTNYLPFFWRRYRAMPRYTYVIEDTSDFQFVESNFTSNVRKNVNKAKGFVTVSNSEDIGLFFEINRMSFLRQGVEIPYSYEVLSGLHNACKEHNCGKMLFAMDEIGNIHSVAYLVWDDQSVYYLLNGTNPEFKSSQANSYLIEQSILLASRMGKRFDFEGSMIKPIEQCYRQFGATQKIYFRIYKTLNPNIPEKIY